MEAFDNVPMSIKPMEHNWQEFSIRHRDRTWYAVNLIATVGGVRVSVWPCYANAKHTTMTLKDSEELRSLLHPDAPPNAIVDALLEHPQCPDIVHELAKRIDWEASV